MCLDSCWEKTSLKAAMAWPVLYERVLCSTFHILDHHLRVAAACAEVGSLMQDDDKT